ncbi:hypothetical protein N7491_000556 [Penicillium cf. griseofulvum]|uniref:BTB domain-containing protein n=1 Tax=Penicillium cf. griseofulvum TaxID=2972120 RepID=A0A9W9MFQ6_9EURO|nr:hypothetical protein N7472_004081 [Penicillium cf. griseofulvum]KAJ5443171.1 hypothetical protein N7445_004284 [Penicillium cf. griseofulvum]KAJ5451374.1 hypothetical protein N7491_000556 [Penicillium cf. griseofulvum]
MDLNPGHLLLHLQTLPTPPTLLCDIEGTTSTPSPEHQMRSSNANNIPGFFDIPDPTNAMAQNSVQCLKNDIKKVQGPTIQIIVRATKEPFHIHESLICTSSLFFKKAMSGSWKESHEHTVELPEDDPEIFALYSYWLYFSKIPLTVEAPEKNEFIGGIVKKEYLDLVSAYVLGDKLFDPKFQNSIIDVVFERCTTPDARDGVRYFPGAEIIIHAYNNTTKSAIIRKLFVDIYVESGKASWLSNKLPTEFLFPVLEALMKKRTPIPLCIEASEYYVEPTIERPSLKRKRSEVEP